MTLYSLGQACANLGPALAWKASLPRPHRYFVRGERAIRPPRVTPQGDHENTCEALIDDALTRRRTTGVDCAAAISAERELIRRCWGMQAVAGRVTLPLHRALGNHPRFDRLLSLVLGARGDGAVGLRLSYEELASECGWSRATIWRHLRRLRDDGWLGVVHTSERVRDERRNATNIYHAGPLFLERLADPQIAAALRREAEVHAYQQQRGTEPHSQPQQQQLVQDPTPAEPDCPRGIWTDDEQIPARDDAVQHVADLCQEAADETAQLVAAMEAACQPTALDTGTTAEADDGLRRQAERAGWLRHDDGTWSWPDIHDDALTRERFSDVELEKILSRRPSSRIATTTPELINYSEKTDQRAHGRADMAERTAALGRGLPAPPRIELDDGSARALEGLFGKARQLGGDVQIKAMLLGASGQVLAGLDATKATALGRLVAEITTPGSRHGARFAAFSELARAIDAMPQAPPGLAGLRRHLEHVLEARRRRRRDEGEEDPAS